MSIKNFLEDKKKRDQIPLYSSNGLRFSAFLLYPFFSVIAVAAHKTIILRFLCFPYNSSINNYIFIFLSFHFIFFLLVLPVRKISVTFDLFNWQLFPFIIRTIKNFFVSIYPLIIWTII